MRISLSQIESARKNPSKFAATFGNGFRGRPYFRLYFDMAIKRFQEKKGTIDQTIEFFTARCEDKLSHQTNYIGRLNRYRETLRIYCDTCANQGLDYFHWSLPVHINVGSHTITGTAKNLHLKVVDSGYSVIHTQTEDADWSSELKWPLIQFAVAESMGATSDEVDVRAFRMDTANFEVQAFSMEEIDEALLESEKLINQVEGILSDVS